MSAFKNLVLGKRAEIGTHMNLDFKKFTIEDLVGNLDYFRQCSYHVSDYSAAFKLMWQNYTQYIAKVGDCLVFRSNYQGRTYFNYPLSKDGVGEDEALDLIEQYCRSNGTRLHFSAVPRSKIAKLIERYGTNVCINNKRRWRDYLYMAQDFISYPGKKYSGQRNHVNKFKRLYPQYEFCALSSGDAAEIKQFLAEFAQYQNRKNSATARDEMQSVIKLTDVLDRLGLLAGGIRIDGKLVSYSVGEMCGDQLIVHVEKALINYDGIYATTAQEFARRFVTDNVRYINREDDSGDIGLRKSKLQYHPIELVDKYTVLPHRAIDSINHYPKLVGEWLEIGEITEIYAEDLYRLEYDEERNRYWGYNWREHYDGEPTPEYFLNGILEDFRRKEELPLGIFYGGKLAGEVVLHNFGYRCDCEIGVRLLPEFEGKGMAKEALLMLINYAFIELDIEMIVAKCFKENERSRRTLLSAGMKASGEDDTYFYFKKTAAM